MEYNNDIMFCLWETFVPFEASLNSLQFFAKEECPCVRKICIYSTWLSFPSALLVGLLLQHTLDTFVGFAHCTLSNPSVLVSGKSHSRTWKSWCSSETKLFLKHNRDYFTVDFTTFAIVTQVSINRTYQEPPHSSVANTAKELFT